MSPVQLAAFVTALLISTGSLFFAWTSLREHKPRAAGLSLGAALLIATLWWIHNSLWTLPEIALTIAVGVIWFTALLYFLPLGKPTAMQVGAVTERVDERTIMFAREEYTPENIHSEQYYTMHPEHKEVDDRLRRLPKLLTPGGRYYDAERSRNLAGVFRATKALTTQVDGDVAADQVKRGAAELTAEIKKLALRLGASEVGAARLNPMFVYSHVGRGPEPWGKPIELGHAFAVAFTLEMNYRQVEQAPDLPITEESGLQYLRGAQISVSLARYIRSLGYPARAHISESNYQIMMPAVAHDAGLGELSRMGYLISAKYGARVRLGAVSTDLPLVADDPVTFGVQDFCDICLKCADNCPPAAIPRGEKENVRGVAKWLLHSERCLHYWRVAGTDCGLCMRVCPFSHPPTLMHNLVRTGINNSRAARRLSVWGDDLFYGRKVCKPDRT